MSCRFPKQQCWLSQVHCSHSWNINSLAINKEDPLKYSHTNRRRTGSIQKANDRPKEENMDMIIPVGETLLSSLDPAELHGAWCCGNASLARLIFQTESHSDKDKP